MKRSVTEIIRRGFDSAVANWPLMLIRIAEGVFFVMIAVGAVVAVVVPLAVSIGLSKIDFESVAVPPEFILQLLRQHWLVLVYIAVLVTVLLIVYVAIHSFVQAGAAHVLASAERNAGRLAVPRDGLRSFTMDRWLSGGRQSWWAVFLIYNLAWAAASLVILLPLIVILVLMIFLRDSPLVVVFACGSVAITLLLALVVSVLTHVWTEKAIALEALRRSGASDSLAEGWSEMWSDFGRHFAVAFIMLVITIGGSAFIASLSMVFSFPFGDNAMMSLAFSPLRLVLSLVSTAFSAAMASWLLASFVALSAE
ncbi:MAG TPA: hypothetical protein VFL80_05540 [Thermoanaerobaculia bacterium]|nr:hypothetical protein [Thermoanaerobaculia bacterium]